MKVRRIDIYWVKLPLAFVWKTSYADQRYTDTILVRMEGGGHYAWGESCPPYIPGYSAEHTVAAFHTVREHMAPRIIGQDIASVVAVGADFGVQDSLEILLQKIQGAIDQGFPRIKLKFRPGWDLPMVEAVRSTFPRFTFHIDCNAAYTPADTDLFKKLDRFHLAMMEQPLADDGMGLINHADLQKRIETPVCLDESALSLAHVQAAIRLGSCKVVNVKMARLDGLAASRDIQALCAEHGMPCWVGGMLESAIGGAIGAELATLPNFTYPGNIFPSSYFYANDVGKPEVVLGGPGEVATSRVAGIIQEPDADLLKQWTAEHLSFPAHG